MVDTNIVNGYCLNPGYDGYMISSMWFTLFAFTEEKIIEELINRLKGSTVNTKSQKIIGHYPIYYGKMNNDKYTSVIDGKDYKLKAKKTGKVRSESSYFNKVGKSCMYTSHSPEDIKNQIITALECYRNSLKFLQKFKRSPIKVLRDGYVLNLILPYIYYADNKKILLNTRLKFSGNIVNIYGYRDMFNNDCYELYEWLGHHRSKFNGNENIDLNTENYENYITNMSHVDYYIKGMTGIYRVASNKDLSKGLVISYYKSCTIEEIIMNKSVDDTV